MSEIDRRFLLGGIAGAAGVAALAQMAKGGPLTPPGGAVASTGRTLTEVYDRVGAAAEPRTVIPGGTGLYTISTSGSYVLGGDLISTSGTTALIINVADVTLDLNGFAVRSTLTSGGSSGIVISSAGDRVTMRNGRVLGFAIGVVASGTNVLLEDLQISGARLFGISSTAANFTARRCVVQNIGIGSSTTETNDSRGISLAADFATVEGCIVSQVFTATLTRTAYGILQGSGTGGVMIIGNRVISCANGIRLNTSPNIVAANNIITGCATPWTNTTGWANAGGNFPVP